MSDCSVVDEDGVSEQEESLKVEEAKEDKDSKKPDGVLCFFATKSYFHPL